MTLDEAIKHCEEVAEQQCDKCGKEHKQLAKWLQELKDIKDNGSDSEIGQKIYDEGYKDE